MTREESNGVRSGSVATTRVRRRWRPTALTAILFLAAQSACGLVTSNESVGTGGAGTGGNATGGHQPASTGGTGNIGGVPDCGPSVADLFADQAVSIATGTPRVFYSWTTDEQVAELRAGGPLFSRSESPGQGRGLALTQLAAFAANGYGIPEETLANVLETTIFAKVRFSWTNPWATLLGWPSETYGNQLLEIELKPEAWIAVFDGGNLYVLDSANNYIATADALANPERIGAIYFLASADGSTSYCGTFGVSAVGFREFVLGNIQMVQRWSLATSEIADRLTADIATLEAFEAGLGCMTLDQASWIDQVTCEWYGPSWQFTDSLTVTYDQSLAIPNALYLPTVDNISALVAALRASMPTGDPLVVTPGG